MPERDGYAPGTPSWVDLATPDVDNAARFYGELFGWEAQETGTIEETGGYRFYLCRGKKVAGVSPLMQDGQPVVWSTYFATDDVDALAERVTEFGGQSFFEPMDVMDAGRMGFFAHPAAGWEKKPMRPAFITSIGGKNETPPNSVTRSARASTSSVAK